MKVCTQCASLTNNPVIVNGEYVCQECSGKFKTDLIVIDYQTNKNSTEIFRCIMHRHKAFVNSWQEKNYGIMLFLNVDKVKDLNLVRNLIANLDGFAA